MPDENGSNYDLPPLTEIQKGIIQKIVLDRTRHEPLKPGVNADPIDKLLGDLFNDTLDENQKGN